MQPKCRLAYQLEKMGKGVVQRQGRLVRFVTGHQSGDKKMGEPCIDSRRGSQIVEVGRLPHFFKPCLGTNFPLSTPLSDSTNAVTRGTVAAPQLEQGLQMAPLNEVSPVTEQDFRRVDTVIDAPPVGKGVLSELEPDGSGRDGETKLLSPIGVCAQDNSSIISDQSAGATETLQNNHFTNTETPAQTEFQMVGNPTNSAPIASIASASAQQSSTQRDVSPQDVSALILQCQTWVQLAQAVGENTKTLVKAANQITTEQRRGLVSLLVTYLCQNPAHLNQLAWVPAKLRDRTLEQLTFTIRRIGGAANVLDACIESISGCKFISVEHIGTRNERWVFQAIEGNRLAVFGVDAIEAIAYGTAS